MDDSWQFTFFNMETTVKQDPQDAASKEQHDECHWFTGMRTRRFGCKQGGRESSLECVECMFALYLSRLLTDVVLKSDVGPRSWLEDKDVVHP